jgi:hypothetical protein
MNIIEEIIKELYYEIYNITSDIKKNSIYFTKIFNKLQIQFNNEFIISQLYFNNNQETIIHSILNSIIDVQLYFKMFNSIYFNNRTDIINNDPIIIPSNYYKCKYYNNKLQYILHNLFDYTSQLTYFLFLLLLEIDNSILLLPNLENLTPIQLFSKKFYIYKKRGLNSKNILLYNSLQMVLIYGKNLVIIQQSFIRRYLAKRYIIKLKKQQCLNDILYASPKQIEFYNFNYFPGGNKVLETANRYNKSISEWCSR